MDGANEHVHKLDASGAGEPGSKWGRIRQEKNLIVLSGDKRLVWIAGDAGNLEDM